MTTLVLHLKTGKNSVAHKLYRFHTHGRTIISYKRRRHAKQPETSANYGF